MFSAMEAVRNPSIYVPTVYPEKISAGIDKLDKTVSKSTFDEILETVESLELQSTQLTDL